MSRELPSSQIKQTALRLLALRDHSEQELRIKLQRKGYADDAIEEILKTFGELGYINDEAFTDRQVKYLARERLYGNHRIERKLREKGLLREQIRRAIEVVRQEFSEAEALKICLAKKRKGRDMSNDPGERRRLAQSLMRQGFPADLIFETIDMMAKE